MTFHEKFNNEFCWMKNSPNWTHYAGCNCGGNNSCFKTEPITRTPCWPEGATGLIQGLKRKIDRLQNEKKFGTKPIKKKQKDYYCLMLRKINGLDKKIQNLENLFISHFDHDSEYSFCAKEFSTRRFDYVDIYCAVRSLTNLANQLKEDILHKQNQNNYSNPEHSSKLYDKMKLLETELSSLSQYWEDCQNIRDSKRLNHEENIGGPSKKNDSGFNNEANGSKKKVKATIKNGKRGSNTKCPTKSTENNNEYYDCGHRSFQNLEEEDEYCAHCTTRNVDRERLSPCCISCDGIKHLKKERLLDGNENNLTYYYDQNKDKQTTLCNLCKGKRRKKGRPYNPISHSYSQCNICGNYMNGSGFADKEPINKYRGENKYHNMYRNNAEEVGLYSRPINKYYKVIRPTKIDANFIEVYDGEPYRNKFAYSQNNKNNYEPGETPRNKMSRRIRVKYNQNRARNSLSDMSDCECYLYDTPYYGSPRGGVIEPDRCRYTTHNHKKRNNWKLDDQSGKITNTSRNIIEVNKYKNVHTNRDCKETRKHLIKDLYKTGYNVYYKNDEIITEKYHSTNNTQNNNHVSDIKNRKTNNYLNKYSDLKNNNDLIVSYTSSESEETSILTNKYGKTKQNIARAHIHVKFNDKGYIRRKNQNNNRFTDQVDLFELNAHQYNRSNTNKMTLNHKDHRINQVNPKNITEFPETAQHYFVKNEYDSRDFDSTSLKTTEGEEYFNPSSLSKVYFCKDLKCTNKANREELIIWPNSNQSEFTESDTSKIVDTLKDFNKNMCGKCTIRSQKFKEHPRNSKHRDRKNKISLNKTVIRCDDCRHNLEDKIRNLVTDKQISHFMNHNIPLKAKIVNDNELMNNKSHHSYLNPPSFKESKFNREIEPNERSVPVFKSNVNKTNLFEESAKNTNFEFNKSLEIPNVGNTINININRGSYSIERERTDKLKALNISPKNSFPCTELSSLVNVQTGDNKAKQNINYVQKNKETTSDNTVKLKNNTSGSELYSEKSMITNNNVKPITLNPKTYQVHTSMKSPFQAQESSSMHSTLKVYNTAKEDDILENKISRTSRSNISTNINRDVETINNQKSVQKQPSIIAKAPIHSVETNVPSKMNMPIAKNDQYSNKIHKISKYPSEKFRQKSSFPSCKIRSNMTSPTTSKQGIYRSNGVLKHTLLCGGQPIENIAVERISNYIQGKINRKPFKHRHTVDSKLPRLEVLMSNEDRIPSYCTNTTIDINGKIKGQRLKAITLTSESSFSVLNWKQIANKLKEKNNV